MDLWYLNGARYYDPILRRFITPDTIVQSPYDPQSLNRYAYCRNNPLNLVDPDGNLFFVPIIVGAVLGGISAGQNHGNVFEGMMMGAMAGAFGSAFGMAGAQIGGTMFGSMIGGAAGSSVSALMGGGDVGKAALGGMAGGMFGYLGALGNSQLFGSMIGGGISAEIQGGKFWEGAKYGAMGWAVANIAAPLQPANYATKAEAGKTYAGSRVLNHSLLGDKLNLRHAFLVGEDTSVWELNPKGPYSKFDKYGGYKAYSDQYTTQGIRMVELNVDASRLQTAMQNYTNYDKYYIPGIADSNSGILSVLLQAGAQVPIMSTGYATFPMLPAGLGVAP